MKIFTTLAFLCTILFGFTSLFGQNSESAIRAYLSENKTLLGLSDSDVKNWIIYDRHTSKQSGVEYLYIRQQHEKIEVYGAVANFAIKNNSVAHAGLRLEKNVSEKVNTTQAKLTPFEAILSAAQHLNLDSPKRLRIIETIDSKHFKIDAHEISLEIIPVQMMFFPIGNELKLVWDLSLYEHSKNHWWSIRVDALSGEVLDKVDWVVSCSIPSCDHSEITHSSRRPIPNISTTIAAPAPPPATDEYRVFGLPLESPSHGSRTLVVGPSDPVASPFGWHDENGFAGPEHTTTQGNNVRATEDLNDSDDLGYVPNGGSALSFDFPLNFNTHPTNNQDAAITNLFYWNNIMHDVWYQYGFDEASGNFQKNNYGNGGVGNDFVFAEAMDGGGTNNANFATPSDGSNPRMQMYLWDGPSLQYLLTINTPETIAGQYSASQAGFGPGLPSSPLTGDFVLVNDGSSSPNLGCNVLTNASAISGKIALVYRGTCTFATKVERAQNAGAIGVIVINNVSTPPITMGGSSSIVTIPSIMVSSVDGAQIVAQLGANVNGTIHGAGVSLPLDGDFDNGIIAHEYGHGISTRLTGGASNSNCLNNAEQMGEGWSDWFGLMLTLKTGDTGTTGRGIGTYALGEPTSGEGIRPTRYSTDFAINPSTYATTNSSSISQPHGIGYVWCTMLWDLNWALIDRYGFDSDFYNGNGGNNIAMQLVIEALKLQPCNPGFVDGRNAILAADMLLYNGANQCLIWEVFANRGLGHSASQGSASSRSDQVQAFDFPPISCNGKLDITVFIEGYYIPASNPPMMVPAYHNNDVFASGGTASSSTDVDSITVELYAVTNLANPAYSQTSMLAADGSMFCSFPDAAVGGNYYLVLKSKNTLELWSANPILLTEANVYDFSNSLSKAYTDFSSAPMATLAPGLFGLYTGNLDQDGFIDGFDYSVFTLEQILSSGFLNFFLASDMNGDGFVDSFDYSTLDNNTNSSVYIQRP